ncbi:WhiB family transcriptional regulator [Paeniglutamicibacter sp. R2-26]|uniref:WhiB family transcriptional regulator n=1 Tax=Paeniglutamicibacter sp. R2-26 TaxID=3144417 RepID=UPI003EE4B541
MLNESIKQALPAPEGKRGDQVDWREQALCAPFKYDPSNDPWFPVSVAQESTAMGMQICARCPVLDTCWSDALEKESRGQVHGIRAGRTSEQRRSVYRRRKRDAAKTNAQAAAEQAA